MSSPPQLALQLYVPDETIALLTAERYLKRMMRSSVPELGFIPPPWWEQSHVIGVGVMPLKKEDLQ